MEFKRFVWHFFRVTFLIIIKIYFRLEIYGIENVKKLKKSFLLASNHRSYLDPPLLGCVSCRKIYFLAKSDLFKSFFGKLIFYLGAFPVDFRSFNVSMVKKLRKLSEEKEILAVFPEGTRSAPGKIRKGRLGVGYLMLKMKVPVICVYISGNGKAWPRNKKIPLPYKLKIFLSQPLTLDDIRRKYPEFNLLSEKQKQRKIADCVMEEITRLSLQNGLKK